VVGEEDISRKRERPGMVVGERGESEKDREREGERRRRKTKNNKLQSWQLAKKCFAESVKSNRDATAL